jgi:hypothetical protein
MLLQKSIFHKVRDQQQLLAKVCAVDGDITQPGLGLAPDTARQLQQEVHIVLHCAADIRLEVSRHQDTAAAIFYVQPWRRWHLQVPQVTQDLVHEAHG